MGKQVGYLVICKDKPGDQPGIIRQEKMADHLAHVEKTIDNLLLAGPMFEGDKVIGSLLIFKADSPEQALEMAKQDPYYKADIWASMDVSRFVGAAGDLVGGTTW